MPITGKRIANLGRVVAVTWTGDAGEQRSSALPTGSDAEILAILGQDAIILAADPPPIVRQADLAIGSTVTTTGTTPAELLRLTLPQHTELDVTVRINAVSRDETQVRKLVADATFGRVAGAPVQIGATTQVALQQTAGAAGWTSPVSIQGNDIVVTVTGSGGLVVDWSIRGVAARFAQAGL